MTQRYALSGRKVVLHDMTLRDGMHAKREQISIDQMVTIATALDEAGVPLLQVTHGAGLGGNSVQHGRAPRTNEQYISAVASKLKRAKVSVLLIPGLGTMKELDIRSRVWCARSPIALRIAPKSIPRASTSPSDANWAWTPAVS